MYLLYKINKNLQLHAKQQHEHVHDLTGRFWRSRRAGNTQVPTGTHCAHVHTDAHTPSGALNYAGPPSSPALSVLGMTLPQNKGNMEKTMRANYGAEEVCPPHLKAGQQMWTALSRVHSVCPGCGIGSWWLFFFILNCYMERPAESHSILAENICVHLIYGHRLPAQLSVIYQVYKSFNVTQLLWRPEIYRFHHLNTEDVYSTWWN